MQRPKFLRLIPHDEEDVLGERDSGARDVAHHPPDATVSQGTHDHHPHHPHRPHHPHVEVIPAMTRAMPSEALHQATHNLLRILEGETVFTAPHQQKAPGSGHKGAAWATSPSNHAALTTMTNADAQDDRTWPDGPIIRRKRFTSEELKRLVDHILMDEEIMDHPSMPGITKQRLRDVGVRAGWKPTEFGIFIPALMLWFARAGVTIRDDGSSATEWARPRPLISDDRAVIRRLLNNTDPPDGDAVKVAYHQEGLKEAP